MNIDIVRRQTQQYFYKDGLIEIGVGIIFAVLGTVFLVLPLLPSGIRWPVVISVPLLIIAGTFATRGLISKLKERIVYPRTGFVKYDEKPSHGRWFVVSGALVIAAAAFFLPEDLTSIALVEGLLLALILSFLGYRVGLVRLYLVATVAIISGIAITLSEVGDTPGSAWVFVIAGVALLLSGFIALVKYLRANPPPKEEA